MFFTEIAEQVAPAIDKHFPPSMDIQVIGESGRYMVAASHTLCCSVTSCRNNQKDTTFEPEEFNDKEMGKQMNEMSREAEAKLVRGLSLRASETENVLATIQDELEEYTKLYASQQLAMQEVELYQDNVDLYKEGYETAIDMIGPPEESQKNSIVHTVEGLTGPLVAGSAPNEEPTTIITLAAAGEAAINGVVMQAVANSGPLQDDYAYYVNDGVYSAFNNIMFDHAICRPRVLRQAAKVTGKTNAEGFLTLDMQDGTDEDSKGSEANQLYASTVFGPTCDSIDVIARSVLLPKLEIGDWLYFTNMGAYTSAAASTFNGFEVSEKFYVCSVQPEYFEKMIAGPEEAVEE